jgi:hypothetical protein
MITNTSKPTTSITNTNRVSSGETWATITTTWASETRTWQEVSQLIDNTAKVGGISVIDSLSQTGTSNYSLYSGSTIGVSQSFTNETTSVLDSLQVRLARSGSPTGDVTARIYAHTGTFGTSSEPTGAALATSENVDSSGLNPIGTSTTGNYYTFTFTGVNRITLSAATKYCLVIAYSGGDSSNKVVVGLQSTGGGSLHSGNNATSTDLSAWTTFSARDLPFSVTAEVRNISNTSKPA